MRPRERPYSFLAAIPAPRLRLSLHAAHHPPQQKPTATAARDQGEPEISSLHASSGLQPTTTSTFGPLPISAELSSQVDQRLPSQLG
jgi:hypothetical protein